MFCDALRQQRHRLKAKFFNGKIVGEITTKSPVEHMTDNQWGGLLRHWADPQNVVQSVNTDTPPLSGFLYMQVPHNYPFAEGVCQEQAQL